MKLTEKLKEWWDEQYESDRVILIIFLVMQVVMMIGAAGLWIGYEVVKAVLTIEVN